MAVASGKTAYRFTFGPWNISTGADPFGPAARKEMACAAKLREYKELGFDGVQFHADDAGPDIDQDPAGIQKAACPLKTSRVGVLIESAHSILAGLDPSDDMANALWHGKLWSVHLNDQNGLKYDQDKVFGSVDLRRAFNTVWVLERAGYDGCIGLDVKAMRSTKAAEQTKHLANSREVFLNLVQLVRGLDNSKVEAFRAERDYEGLEMHVL